MESPFLCFDLMDKSCYFFSLSAPWTTRSALASCSSSAGRVACPSEGSQSWWAPTDRRGFASKRSERSPGCRDHTPVSTGSTCRPTSPTSSWSKSWPTLSKKRKDSDKSKSDFIQNRKWSKLKGGFFLEKQKWLNLKILFGGSLLWCDCFNVIQTETFNRIIIIIKTKRKS